MDKTKLTKAQIQKGTQTIAKFMNMKFVPNAFDWIVMPFKGCFMPHDADNELTSNQKEIRHLLMSLTPDEGFKNKYDFLFFHRSWEWLVPAMFQFMDEWNRHRESNPFHNTRFWGDFKGGLLNQDILASFKAVVEGMEWLNDYIESHK